MKERRRAVDGKLIEVSKSNPGYYKYQFTIKELDGDESVIPSYGVDMTDALQRILKNEKKEKLNDVYVKKVEPTIMISVVLVWLTMIGLSMFIPDHPEYALYGTIGLMSIVMIIAVHNFFKKYK
jgi:hypothetical protein|tara:strand:+ start:987 stop:1358 length:372 start_codon:yes stop_codon:yes gene_type:complete